MYTWIPRKCFFQFCCSMDQLLNATCHYSWKAYCISLPRCTERRERFSQWAKENGLPFTFWDAFDKENLSEEELHRRGVYVGKELSPGATACRISHERLWKHILENDQDKHFFFILEDDAGFLRKSFRHLQEFLEKVQASKLAWGILHFGFGTMTGYEMNILNSRIPPGIYKPEFCDQTHAMLYNVNAIREIYTLSLDPKFHGRASDGLFLTFIHKKKGIVLVPKESILEQTDPVSYVGAGSHVSLP